jgi:hypothetical protein
MWQSERSCHEQVDVCDFAADGIMLAQSQVKVLTKYKFIK